LTYHYSSQNIIQTSTLMFEVRETVDFGTRVHG